MPQAHLLRSVNQEEEKHIALTQLDEETCLIIMDWAMKYLPQQFREQMSEFFGKRGRSWHISAVITRSQEEGRCEVECFVHLFNTCKKTASRLCQSLSIYFAPSRSSTLQSTKLFCDQTTLVVITVGP